MRNHERPPSRSSQVRSPNPDRFKVSHPLWPSATKRRRTQARMRERSRMYLEERATSPRSRDAVVPEPKVPIGALPAPAEDAISPCTFVTGTVRWFAESRPHPYERYRQRDESDCHNLASHRATLVTTPTRMVAVLWQLCGVDPWGERGFTDAPGRAAEGQFGYVTGGRVSGRRLWLWTCLIATPRVAS